MLVFKFWFSQHMLEKFWYQGVEIYMTFQALSFIKSLLHTSYVYISTRWYWNFSCLILYLSDSTSRTRIFRKHPITSACCKGYWPGMSFIFLLISTGICLSDFISYPIVTQAPAFLQSSRDQLR